ncbi:MAG: acyl-CoA thioesterase/bile acid-CoA:amino acid N-acyltransferase family protein [Pseudomonadota bacterium]
MELYSRAQRVSAPLVLPQPEPLILQLEGLAPGETVGLRSTLQDDAGVAWQAMATWRADATGSVRCDQEPLASSSFEGADAEGLFWSVSPNAQAIDTRAEHLATGVPLVPALDPLAPLEYALEARAEHGGEARWSIVRQRVADGVRRQAVTTGRLRGELFEPAEAAGGAVLVLGGSEGGAPAARAAALASRGLAALALGYFDYDDRPSRAIDLPLEYFDEALDWLRQRFPRRGIAIWGGSRGSEAALLSAAHQGDKVQALLLLVPSHIVNSGFDMLSGEDFSLCREAMWSRGGRPLAGAYLEQPGDAVQASRRAGMRAAPGYRFAPEYLKAWQRLGQHSRFDLPIGEVLAPVLAISAGDDGLWPSRYAAEALVQRGVALGVDARHAVLEGAGHAVGMPNEPRPCSHLTLWSGGYSGVEAGLINLGGSPAVNAAAARQCWQVALDFLAETL